MKSSKARCNAGWLSGMSLPPLAAFEVLRFRGISNLFPLRSDIATAELAALLAAIAPGVRDMTVGVCLDGRLLGLLGDCLDDVAKHRRWQCPVSDDLRSSQVVHL